MATKADGVRIPVGLDQQGIVDGLKSIENEIRNSAIKWNAVAQLAGKAWSALAAPFRIAGDAISRFVAASAEAEAAERRAFVALQTRTTFTAEAFAELKRYNQELQQRAALDADSLLQIQGTLAALGVMPSKMRAATEATVGLSEATGRTLAFSARSVARDIAQGGRHIELWARSLQIAEARAQSYSGQVALLEINMGDLEETLGSTVTRSGAVTEGLQAINRATARLTEYLDSDAGRLAVDRFFRVLAGGAASTIDAFLGMVRLARDLRTEVSVAWAELRANIAGDDTWSLPIDETSSAIDEMLLQTEDLSDQLRKIARGSATLANGPGGAGGSGGPMGAARSREERGRRVSIRGEDDPFGLSADAERAQQIEALAEAEAEAKRRFAAVQAEADQQTRDAEFEAQLAHHQRMLVSRQAFFGSLLDAGVAGFGQLFSTLGAQMASGQVDIEGALGQLLAGIGQQLGQFLIAAGGAAVAGGILGTAVPIFGAILGGPQAIAAGAGLIAAGGLLAGLSGALGGGGGRGSAGPGAGRASGGRGTARGVDLAAWTGAADRLAGAGAPAGFVQGSPATITRVYNIHFGSGVVVARNELEGARTIRKLLEQLERNNGGRR